MSTPSKWITYEGLPDKGLLPPAKTYGPWVRSWHWMNALATLTLVITGYFIGTPPPSSVGDTSSLYLMGWTRFIHLSAGYLFSLLCVMRIIIIPIEKGGTLQLFLPPFWRQSWLEGLWTQIKWNFLLLPKYKRYLGLNPLASTAMIFLFVFPTFLLMVTGLAMFAEVTGHDSWQYKLFGWVTLLWGNTLDLHILHRMGMWVLVWFISIHVFVTVRDDVIGRQTMISSMISGERLFRK